MNPDFSVEEKFLIKKDKILSQVIKANGPIKFSTNKKDPFNALVDIIISPVSYTHLTLPTKG